MGALAVRGRLENIIAADPAAAAQAAAERERSQGVWVGQSSDSGIKDIFIRTEAPNAIWFDASIDWVADSLATLGDTDTKDVRRAKAVVVLVQPQQALNLFDTSARVAAGGAPFHEGAAANADVEVDADQQGGLDGQPVTAGFGVTGDPVHPPQRLPYPRRRRGGQV